MRTAGRLRAATKPGPFGSHFSGGNSNAPSLRRLKMYVPPRLLRMGFSEAELFFDRFELNSRPSITTDWRAKKLKECIDINPGILRVGLNRISNDLELGISGRRAARLFRTEMKVGLKKYARNVRLGKARKQLQQTDVPIKIIAADLGYADLANFCRAFKARFHLSPLQFRRIIRQSRGR